MLRTKNRQNYGRVRPAAFVAIALMAAFALGGAFFSNQTPASAQSAPLPRQSVVASTTGLNVRALPSASSLVLATMPINGRATILDGPFNTIWYLVNYNGTQGYASGRFLVAVDDKYTPVPLPTGSPSAQTTPTAESTESPIPGIFTPTPVGSPTAQVSASPQQSATPQGTPAPAAQGVYTGLWLGEMAYAGSVRSGPGKDQPVIKGWWVGRRVLLYQSVTDASGGVWYRVSEPPEAPMYVHSSLIRKVALVLFESARFKGRWVNVNLTQQVVIAYEDGTPVMVTLGSTGKAKTPTDVGTWKIYWRLTSQTMEGGNLASGDYYKLPNVPYPQYFNMTGESLHGTYWHDNFGRPMSHGCVNLSIPMSKWFYEWDNVGTIVYVHY